MRPLFAPLRGSGLVATLSPGPLDVIGDVHGEIDALHGLLARLGYDPTGAHPDRRSLVFVGDLGDRGPDSPAVYRLVRDWVTQGRALCLLGNHELNLLRGSKKEGNGWFWPTNHEASHFPNCVRLPDSERADLLAFLGQLPLAAERPDLRVVHAAWDANAIVRLRATALGAVALYEESEQRIWEELGSPTQCTPAEEQCLQNDNPVRVTTSGQEQPAHQPFYANGRLRYLERTPWWEDYGDEVAVVFGHYWRRAAGAAPAKMEVPPIFGDASPQAWLGPKGTAMCVDYSVGNRYRERLGTPKGIFDGRLAAVRWPEAELILDDGRTAGHSA